MTAMPKRMTPVSRTADRREAETVPSVPTKNMVISAMRVGNRPLHGTKVFVRMASSRSRGESMIRQPMTPAALHPNPMHMGFGLSQKMSRSRMVISSSST